MVDDATPTQSLETAPANDAAPETALGSAVADTAEVVDTPADPAKADAAEPEVKAEAEADTPVVPETYELAGTDGAELDAEALAAATPVFQELGLTNDQAQKLMPVAEQFAQQVMDKHNRTILAAVQTERAQWLDTAKADPEIGGQAWDSNMVVAAKALDTLGFNKGSAFRVLLDESGLGNHPEMIRAFVKVGKAISEDSDFPRGGVATTGPRTAASVLYPSKS